MIRITSKKDGFRRAGIAHPATPTDYPEDAFTREQAEALMAESMLIIQRVDESGEPDPSVAPISGAAPAAAPAASPGDGEAGGADESNGRQRRRRGASAEGDA